jgi:hypothetical protein
MYKVIVIDSVLGFGDHSFPTLGAAAFQKKTMEVNWPSLKGRVSVYDEELYLVPSTELENALKIYRMELENNLRILNS